ncbi:MAG: hypothetical protein ACLP2H_09965 [Terriglobales bacterium]
MSRFLLVGVTILGSAFVANTLLNVLGRFNRRILIGVTFAVAGAGAYAAAFVFDMITLAWAGELPPANIVWPCLTWSLIAFSLLMVGAGRPVPFAALAAPFWLIGGLAMFSSLAHPRNLVAAITLILGGIAYGSVAAQRGGGATGTAEERGQPKARRGHAPTIGPYRLDTNTGDVSKLVELTPDEKRALNPGVEFKGERIYHAPPAGFAGANWDIVLGAVDNRVYKVSALLVFEKREQRDRMWRHLDGLLRIPLGTPADECSKISTAAFECERSSTASANLISWDTEDGNVNMNRAGAGGAYAVVLTLTSLAASGFVRIK